MVRDYPIAGRVPGWYFRMREKSASVWDVEGKDIYGREVSRLSVVDEERALFIVESDELLSAFLELERVT